jgi:hypothetical protein
MGMQANYEQGGSYNGYSLITGVTTNPYGQQASWIGAFRTKGNAVVGLVIPSNISQAQQILTSLK